MNSSDRPGLNVVYASALTIRNPTLLSTLALYYDTIYLPHPYDLDPEQKPLMRWPGKYWDSLEFEQSRYTHWKEPLHELFDAGVLELLPPPVPADGQSPQDLSERLREELGIKVPHFNKSVVFSGRLALAVHALYAQTKDPEFVQSRPGDTSIVHVKAILAQTLLEYRLPQIGALQPEQLLQARAEIAPYKQGFINYLSQMVDDVESRLPATSGDEREAARRTVERRIAPDLEEYLAQAMPEKISWWSGLIKRVAAGVGSVLSVAMKPWDLGHYPDVLETIADATGYVSDRAVVYASHRHRAFQYIGKLETMQERAHR